MRPADDRPLTEVADGVHVATSPVYATTSTVVLGDRGRCLVIDPALTAAEVDGLSATLRRRGWRPVAVWSTHPHWDHLLDGPGLSDLPRWAAAAPMPGWRARAEGQRDADEEAAGAGALAAITSIAPAPFPRAGDGTVLDWACTPRLVADRAYLDGLGDPVATDPRLCVDASAWLHAADREQRAAAPGA